jgi:hypothetical protein
VRFAKPLEARQDPSSSLTSGRKRVFSSLKMS